MYVQTHVTGCAYGFCANISLSDSLKKMEGDM